VTRARPGQRRRCDGRGGMVALVLAAKPRRSTVGRVRAQDVVHHPFLVNERGAGRTRGHTPDPTVSRVRWKGRGAVPRPRPRSGPVRRGSPGEHAERRAAGVPGASGHRQARCIGVTVVAQPSPARPEPRDAQTGRRGGVAIGAQHRGPEVTFGRRLHQPRVLHHQYGVPGATRRGRGGGAAPAGRGTPATRSGRPGRPRPRRARGPAG
jgi:hypothetical protein